MGILITPYSVAASNINSQPIDILACTNSSLFINSVLITNKTGQDLLVNLRHNIVAATSVSVFWAYNSLVKPYKTVNLLDFSNIDVNDNQFAKSSFSKFTPVLVFDANISPNRIDSLTVFSGASTQLYDCEVFYSILNEMITP